MNFFIIIRGPLGSGKTTIAKKLAEIINAEYIAIDEILDEHDLTQDREDGYISQKSFLKANEIAVFQADNFLKKGKNVIFDGNFYWKSQIEDLVQKLDYPHHIFTLQAPLSICIERDSKRKNPHGVDAATVIYEKTAAFACGTPIDALKPINFIIDSILTQSQPAAG